MWNVILGEVRATMAAVEKQWVLHILSVCMWPQLSNVESACAVLYRHLRPVRLHNIFPPYFINGTIFGGGDGGDELLNLKCVFWLRLLLLSDTFIILRSIQRYVIINFRWSSCKVPVHSCQILMILEFSRQIFEKYSYIKFHELRGDCSMRTDGQTNAQTDIRDEANNRFSPFCERA